VNTVITLTAAGIALFAWVSVFKIVPACSASFLRYRLWRLRDKLVDEIRHGRFRDQRQPKRLVSLVETAIEDAADLTALNLFLLRVSVGRVPPPRLLDLEEVHPADQALIEAHVEELARAAISHTLRGTPSGWLVATLLLPPFLLVALVSRLFRGKDDGDEGSVFHDAKLHVKDIELVDPALALVGRTTPGRRHGSLYQRV
jgi:hypothetical protein